MTLLSPQRTASLPDHRSAGSVGRRTATVKELHDVPPAAEEFEVEQLASGIFRICVAGRVRGYIEPVGTVFVSLRGRHYNRAVEVHQALVFAQAVRALVSP